MAMATERIMETGEPAQRRGSTATMKKPANGKCKPRTKQPKKVKFITTEIRCQEKTRGGLRYEVILSEPKTPKSSPSPSTVQSPSQIFNIEEKLRLAEERRNSIEAGKLAFVALQLSRIEEVTKKRDELNKSFVNATKESLDNKMNNMGGKREAHIHDLKSKLKEHLESVEKTRLSLEQQTEEVRKSVEEKLKTAAAQRDENTKKMLDRLKEHEDKVASVRQGITERVQQLESQIQNKLDQARERRESIEREQKEKLRNHEKRVEMVRLKAKAQNKDEEKENGIPTSG